MLSSSVTRIQKKVQAIESFILSHGDAIYEGIDRRTRPLLAEGEMPPDVAALAVLVAGLLRQGRERLVVADQRHEAEKARDKGARRHRDQQLQQLRATLIRAKRSVEGAYGVEGFDQILGLEDPVVARDAITLLRQVQGAIDYLRRPDFTLPGEGLVQPLDPAALADALELASGDLRAALTDVQAERRRTETTRVERQAALRALRLVRVQCTALVASLGAVGEQAELASLLRQLVRSPRGGGGEGPPTEGPPTGEIPPPGGEPPGGGFPGPVSVRFAVS